MDGIGFGRELVGCPSRAKGDVNRIFSGLLASMFCIVALGNLILGHGDAIKPSVAIGAVCIAIVLAWYGLWIVLSSITWSLLVVLMALAGAAYDSSGMGVGLVWALSALGGVLAGKH